LKKTAAILLIALLSFNWIGYKLVINYLQKKADHQLEARIDLNDYDESQLLEIRVALNMPYQNTWTEFERQYGEIQIEGNYYTYVKRKIEDGWLILKCIPNAKKQELKNKSNDIFKINNGIDQEQNGKTSSPLAKVMKAISGDFEDHSFCFEQLNLVNHPNNRSQDPSSCMNGFFTSPEQPPENLQVI
jgi:hypothetical protein